MLSKFIILDQVNSKAHLVIYTEADYSQVYLDYNDSIVIPWNEAIQINSLVESTLETIPTTNPTRS